MTKWMIVLSLLIFSQQASLAQQIKPSSVDYPGFVSLSQQAQTHRQQRLVKLDHFLEMAQAPNTLILDTRSADAYQRKHFKGAVHLNFSDFTTEKLAKVIPHKNTRILIYCNNNLDNDPQNFPTKMMPLALNIPTFINLYGYGYQNIYELSELIDIQDKRLLFAGTDI